MVHCSFCRCSESMQGSWLSAATAHERKSKVPQMLRLRPCQSYKQCCKTLQAMRVPSARVYDVGLCVVCASHYELDVMCHLVCRSHSGPTAVRYAPTATSTSIQGVPSMELRCNVLCVMCAATRHTLSSCGSHRAVNEQLMRESLLREVQSAILVSGTTEVPTVFFGGGVCVPVCLSVCLSASFLPVCVCMSVSHKMCCVV